MKGLIFLITIFVVLSNAQCKKEDQGEKDDKIIQDYIAKNNLIAIKHSSGLYYVIKTEGAGNNPTINNTVTVNYKGFLTDGTLFDGTTTKPATFPLSNLIPGWQIGIPLIKKGGEIKLLLPSALAYGTRGSGSIGPNQVLIFDIQLVSF
jgi:FKBP-type peptidyl-prolyl cis-trans isomerase FkpA